MKDKICLITGANSGIGEVTATELAKKGAHIVMVCRNAKKAAEAKKRIIRQSGQKQVEIILADLAIQDQIHRAAEIFNSTYPKLDVLINNAGVVMGKERKVTPEGFEMTFAVNHLAPFLLTASLFDKIRKSEQGRIITVSSEAHRYANLDFNDIQLEEGYGSWTAYGNSKLFNILFTKELARRVEGTSVVANCLHPGVIASNFAMDSTGIMNFIFRLARPFFMTPEQGAETSVYLAASEEASRYNGKYFKKKKVAAPTKLATSKYNATRLWEISEALTKKNFLPVMAQI